LLDFTDGVGGMAYWIGVQGGREWRGLGPRVVGQGVVGDWIGIEAEGNLDDWADGE